MKRISPFSHCEAAGILIRSCLLTTEHMYGYISTFEVFAPMVFCRQCQRKVEDCEHCVLPIQAARVRVFDEKVESVAYAEEKRILEIAFKSGQVWQLADVPAGIYAELRNSTISSFLKFIATRYKASPVNTGIHAIVVPKNEPCPLCHAAMAEQNRMAGALDKFIRVFWLCPSCKKSKWESYGSPTRQQRERWH